MDIMFVIYFLMRAIVVLLVNAGLFNTVTIFKYVDLTGPRAPYLSRLANDGLSQPTVLPSLL